jgi:hypothetical protein
MGVSVNSVARISDVSFENLPQTTLSMKLDDVDQVG